MKFRGFITFVLIVITASYNLLLSQNTLNISIKNIELLEGEIFVSLSNDSTEFPGEIFNSKMMQRKMVAEHSMQFIYENLPDGDYAIAVFQDLNQNEELDTRKFGIPAEPFAFSKDALKKFGPPHFKQAKFSLVGGRSHQEELNMIYRKPKNNNKSQ